MAGLFVIPTATRLGRVQTGQCQQGATGVDEESIEMFERRLGDNLYKPWNRMSSGSYFSPPVLGVPISKQSGDKRLLGISTVADSQGRHIFCPSPSQGACRGEAAVFKKSEHTAVGSL